MFRKHANQGNDEAPVSKKPRHQYAKQTIARAKIIFHPPNDSEEKLGRSINDMLKELQLNHRIYTNREFDSYCRGFSAVDGKYLILSDLLRIIEHAHKHNRGILFHRIINSNIETFTDLITLQNIRFGGNTYPSVDVNIIKKIFLMSLEVPRANTPRDNTVAADLFYTTSRYIQDLLKGVTTPTLSIEELYTILRGSLKRPCQFNIFRDVTKNTAFASSLAAQFSADMCYKLLKFTKLNANKDFATLVKLLSHNEHLHTCLRRLEEVQQPLNHEKYLLLKNTVNEQTKPVMLSSPDYLSDLFTLFQHTNVTILPHEKMNNTNDDAEFDLLIDFIQDQPTKTTPSVTPANTISDEDAYDELCAFMRLK